MVITKRTLIGTLTLFATAVLSAGPAQTPGTPSSSSPQTQPVGCLYRESQVPGRKPTVVERAGILEDYILADATMPAPARPGAPAAVGTSGTTPSTGNMYKVENIADDRLKALVGKRIEVTGRIDPEAAGLGGGPARDRGLGPDEVNLPEFEAASIREVSGTCAAVPAARK
jgi:hypothetical protein